MQVRNYIVENREELVNQLEKELCQQGISYVKIGYEFHFLDQIIRFYDFEIDKRMVINAFFINEEQKKMKKLEENLSIVELGNEMFRKYNQADIILDLNHRNMESGSMYYQKRTKLSQKQESHKVKQQLRRYSR